ncbi:heterokaryon incompatibility protein-domain-containing protein [Aspergillus granulosus]|uniref:Heterokaryon incompatibility protein-domain-containing protein n=1 Tax=Aspergillus granulosus TaxID=176169 RepID=A0ABR4GTN0_9EURO
MRPFCPLCRLLLALTGSWNDHPGAHHPWLNGYEGFSGGHYNILAFVDEETSKIYLPKRGKAITSRQIDACAVKGWLERCSTAHSEECSVSRSRTRERGDDHYLKTLRVIDTTSGCLVPAPTDCRYFALSYMWGNVAQVLLLRENQSQLMQPGGVFAVRDKLPLTIQDAITFLQQIGERYLWVDSLCLIQDDMQDLSSGIAVMNLVYRGATATIIAASGCDANAGLPGVRPDSRSINQCVEEISPGVRMVVLRDVEMDLRKSTYRTRAWTFQEEVLSGRRIVFVNNSVFYTCARGTFREDSRADPFFESEKHGLAQSLIQIALDAESPPLATYETLVFYYTERQLTNDGDAINAFAGMMRVVQERLATPFLHGLPTCSFDISILFVGCHLRRRSAFPSYSWAGWAGPVEWLPSREWSYEEETGDTSVSVPAREWLNTATWIDWYARASDQSIKPVIPQVADVDSTCRVEYVHRSHALWERRRLPTEDLDLVAVIHEPGFVLLQFWTYVVHLGLALGSPKELPGTGGVLPRPLTSLLVVDERGNTCGYVIPNNLSLVPKENPVEFVVLSECSEVRSHNYTPPWSPEGPATTQRAFRWVMLITRENGIAERRGIGVIHEDAVEHSYPPGPVWREVVLG